MPETTATSPHCENPQYRCEIPQSSSVLQQRLVEDFSNALRHFQHVRMKKGSPYMAALCRVHVNTWNSWTHPANPTMPERWKEHELYLLFGPDFYLLANSSLLDDMNKMDSRFRGNDGEKA